MHNKEIRSKAFQIPYGCVMMYKIGYQKMGLELALKILFNAKSRLLYLKLKIAKSMNSKQITFTSHSV